MRLREAEKILRQHTVPPDKYGYYSFTQETHHHVLGDRYCKTKITYSLYIQKDKEFFTGTSWDEVIKKFLVWEKYYKVWKEN